MLKLKRNTINLLITFFLISLFSFFITFNKFYNISTNNNLILIIPLFIILISIVSYLILLFTIPLKIYGVKKFYLENHKLLLPIFALIALYVVSYFISPIEITSNSTLLNFLFKNTNLSNFIFKNFTVIFLIIFILNIFLINQLKFQEKEVFNILLKFSIFFLFLAILQNILFYINKEIWVSNYISDANNCIYFQFLPFGISGKRNYEIIPFIIGYALTLGLNKNKYLFLNSLFFIACYLTYSKNLWVTLIFLNIIGFFIFGKIFLIKRIFVKIFFLVITIYLLSFYLSAKDQCNPRIIDYTKIKIISLININNNEELNSIKKETILKLTPFQVYYGADNKISDNEFIAKTDYLLDSTKPRMEIYKESLKKISEKKLFGYGVNNYTLESNNSSNSESEFLKILLDIGVVGMILWLYFSIQLFKNCKSNWSFLILLSIMSLSLFNIYSWFLPIYFILTCVIFFEKNVRTKSIL